MSLAHTPSVTKFWGGGEGWRVGKADARSYSGPKLTTCNGISRRLLGRPNNLGRPWGSGGSTVQLWVVLDVFRSMFGEARWVSKV